MAPAVGKGTAKHTGTLGSATLLSSSINLATQAELDTVWEILLRTMYLNQSVLQSSFQTEILVSKMWRGRDCAT